MSKILLFLDLDDTIFQTRRKNIKGEFPATHTANPENVSYMTKAQKTFTELFLEHRDIKIIPVTARDTEQYNRTFISRSERVDTASVYFAGAILHKGDYDYKWKKYIDDSLSSLKTPVSRLWNKFDNYIDKKTFKLINVDNYYVCIKHNDKNNPDYQQEMDILVEKIRELLDDEYFIHYNSNNIAMIPEFLDKKYAVRYLIEIYKPDMTIGAGDSISDLNFMSLCDFRIFPGKSQIEKLLKL